MGQKKHIPPIPETAEERAARIEQLEVENLLRRERKTLSMQRYRAKLKRGAAKNAEGS